MPQLDKRADVGSGRHIGPQSVHLAPEDDPDWLASNDSFAPLQPSSSRMREDLSGVRQGAVS